MSANQNVGSNDSARPRRTVKKTLRAQEIIDSGETFPGLPSPDTSDDAAFTASAPTMARRGAVSGGMPPVSSRDEVPVGQTPIPKFTPQEFPIYYWEYPTPTNFLKLSDSRKAWKLKIDEQEKTQDIDDGCDEWDEFCGNRASYPASHRNGFALEFAVASTFLKRAKRAFWAGKSWSVFEFKERVINSETAADIEPDPKRRSLLLEEALDNKFRLAIFEALKRRLCEEIWLEPYLDPPGLVKLQLPKRNSKVPNLVRTTAGLLDMSTGKIVPEVDLEELKEGLKRARISSRGVNSPGCRTMAEEIGMREPDFSESDKD